MARVSKTKPPTRPISDSDSDEAEDLKSMALARRPSPGLPAPHPATHTETAIVEHRGVQSDATIRRMLESQGIEQKHVGGSLPLIKLDKEGQALLVQFVARTVVLMGKNSDEEVPFLVFDILNVETYSETKDAASSIIYRAQIIENQGLATYYASDPVGSVCVIVYNGSVQTKNGLTPFKLYSVNEIEAPE